MSRRFVVLLLAQGLAACGSGPSALAPSPAPRASSQAAPTLFGYVGDSVFRAVAGARVDVMDGPLAGTSTTTDTSGRFSYAGPLSTPITFRATKDGYIPATQVSRAVQGTVLVVFELDAVVPPVSVAGDYTLTLIADNACADRLPSVARTRTYAATIAPRTTSTDGPATHFTLRASGPNAMDLNSFPVGVAGTHVAFAVWNGEAPGLVESIAPKTYLGFYGEADAFGSGSVSSTLAVPFDGTIESCVVMSEPASYQDCDHADRSEHAQCVSKNHQLILTRR